MVVFAKYSMQVQDVITIIYQSTGSATDRQVDDAAQSKIFWNDPE